jgi:hypothetical protein
MDAKQPIQLAVKQRRGGIPPAVVVCTPQNWSGWMLSLTASLLLLVAPDFGVEEIHMKMEGICVQKNQNTSRNSHNPQCHFVVEIGDHLDWNIRITNIDYALDARITSSKSYRPVVSMQFHHDSTNLFQVIERLAKTNGIEKGLIHAPSNASVLKEKWPIGDPTFATPIWIALVSGKYFSTGADNQFPNVFMNFAEDSADSNCISRIVVEKLGVEQKFLNKLTCFVKSASSFDNSFQRRVISIPHDEGPLIRMNVLYWHTNAVFHVPKEVQIVAKQPALIEGISKLVDWTSWTVAVTTFQIKTNGNSKLPVLNTVTRVAEDVRFPVDSNRSLAYLTTSQWVSPDRLSSLQKHTTRKLENEQNAQSEYRSQYPAYVFGAFLLLACLFFAVIFLTNKNKTNS